MLASEIDHVQIAAAGGSEQAARDFFGRLRGLEEVEKPTSLASRGGCWFKVGSQQVHIGVEKDFRPATKSHPAFTVRDIEKFLAPKSPALGTTLLEVLAAFIPMIPGQSA